MKYKIEIKTQYATYQIKSTALTENEFQENMDAMAKLLLSVGNWLQFETVDNKTVILSKNVLLNSILEVTPNDT